MAETTGISWCDRTWSPWIGCTKVSPACDGCYAAHLMDTRLHRVEWGPHGKRKRTGDAYWGDLTKWNREAAAAGRIISVFPSLCDPWDNAADPGIRREWFAVMRETPHLLHLLLSKRPQNAVAMAEAAGGLPANAALGATCEDQKRADINVPALLAAKKSLGARVAFLSCEPLLELIDLDEIRLSDGRIVYPLLGSMWVTERLEPAGNLPALDWIITGGETDQGQHKARPSNPDWFRSIRDQCDAAGVPYHHKQNGEWAEATAARIVQHGPVFGWRGEVSDWMDQSVTFEDDSTARLRAHSFTPHATNLVFRVGKKVAGRLLDGVEHNGMPGSVRRLAGGGR